MTVGTDPPRNLSCWPFARRIPNRLRNRELFTLPVGHAAGPPGYDETLTERVFSFFEDHLGISDTSQSARRTE